MPFDVAGAKAAGYTDAEISAHLASNPEPAGVEAGAPDEMPGAWQSALIGAGRTTDRIVKGAQQAWMGATGDTEGSERLRQQVEGDNAAYAPLAKAHPIATSLGESAPSLVVPVGGAASIPTTLAKLAASGAVAPALEYGSVGERAKGAAMGAAGSVAGGYVVPKVAGAIVNTGKNALKGLAGEISAPALALYEKAKALGIPVNIAQLADSKFVKTLSAAAEQMPFTGATDYARKQMKEFTRKVSNTFGADTDKITSEVYAANRDRLGKEFDRLSMQNTLNLDETLMGKLDAIKSEVSQFGTDDSIKAVDNVIDRLLKQSNASTNEVPVVAQAGVPRHSAVFEVPGAAYQSLDSAVSKVLKAGGEKAIYLKEVQKAVRDAMDRSISPADKEAWDTARSQYRNLKAVRDIVAKDGATGDVSPTQLMAALNNSEAGKEAMAKGTRGGLGDLGKIGKQFVRDAVPNSGTAQRAMAMGLIGGGGYAFGADPTTIAGMMAGSATVGKMVTKIINNPKTIEAMQRKGISLSDFMQMSPGQAAQIIGSQAGQSVVNAQSRN